MGRKSKRKTKVTPLKKTTAAKYALLLTSLFFAVGQINLFNLSGSLLNDKIFQVGRAFVEYEGPDDGEPPLSADPSLPIVMLFSDTAAQLDHYGWPPKLMDLYDVIEEAYMADAEAIYIDLVIRSASHDPAGFCQMIEEIADLRGEGNLASLILPDEDSSEPCLQNTGKLEDHALHRFFHSDKTEYYGLTADKDIKTPIIFSAPLEYLKARDAYYEYKNTHYDSSGSEKDTYIKAIKNWPGIAYLDQVALLAPYEVSTKDGRSSYIWVDKNNYFTPAYIMACLKKKHLPNTEPCDPEKNAKENSSSDLYLLWQGGYRGWNSLGADRSLLQSQYTSCDTGQRERLIWQLLSHVTPVIDSEKRRVRCPYYPTIDLANYITGIIPGSVLKSALQNRNVLIGTDMNRFNDYVKSPVQGEVPGIYSHATSLDNQIRGLRYQAQGESSSSGRWTTNVLLALKYGLFALICWVFLVYKNEGFKYIEKHRRGMTWIITPLMFLATLYISCKFLEVGSSVAKTLAVIIALIFSLYAFLITFFASNIKQLPLKKKTRKRLYRNVCNRRNGLLLFAPHVMVIVLTFVVLIALGNLISLACKIAPPDFISVFISLMPLYLMASRDNIADGLAQFLGNKAIADTLLD